MKSGVFIFPTYAKYSRILPILVEQKVEQKQQNEISTEKVSLPLICSDLHVDNS